MASSPPVILPTTRLGATQRVDRWWLAPLTVAIGLAAFGGYATWAIFQGQHYFVSPYLSPFYSPCLATQCPEEIRILGLGWWPFSPAILIMGAILGFRGTCYYYRKAYYRAYFLDPPACSVEEHRGGRYRGETSFPWVLQNLHRYFLYLSIPIILFLWYDTVHAFRFDGGFGIGLGSVVLLVNVVLLSGYLFGCHSLRHLIGGRTDCYSCVNFPGARHGAWRISTIFNRHHMFWAWTSLAFVCFADFYVRMVSMGVWGDPRIL
jgi:hypothetical protein